MATTTFNYTTAQATRMGTAFGKELGLPGSATEPQIKAEIWNYVRAVVGKWEKQTAEAAALATADAGLTDLGGVT